jgi:hypothetical protein
MPCPICGKNFGGHEWAETLKETWFRGIGTCPNCADECRKRNAASRLEQAKEEVKWYSERIS